MNFKIKSDKDVFSIPCLPNLHMYPETLKDSAPHVMKRWY